MDAIIKITAAEFDEELFKKIGNLLKDRNADITIVVHDRDITSQAYWNRLNKSIIDIDAGRGTTFSMAELEDFIKQ